MSYTVSLEKCSSYNEDEVSKSIARLIDNLGGISKFVRKNQKVLLKPNIVKGISPEACATTHPIVVEAVLKILKGQNCKILVGDSPFADDAIEAMKICGIYDVCKKHGAEIAVFDRKIKVKNQNGLVVKEFPLADCFKEADTVINLPKLKTHSQLYFTGAIKNLYSMMPGPRRGFYHLKYSNMEYFANMLLDLYSLLRKKVVLNVIDGVYGMEGNGPCGGTPKFAGILSASSDANALDFVMCSLIGLDTSNLPTLRYAKKRKDFMFDEEKIKIVGERLKDIRIGQFKEAQFSTLNMMPKFVTRFQSYIIRHRHELVY